ncbi:MAG TPA: S49 family peptidase [Polyangiaceae bacterium]|nr:S49 family peptidase [Polyangiaceae bacterium]
MKKMSLAAWWNYHRGDLLCLDGDLSEALFTGDPQAFDIEMFLEPPAENETLTGGVCIVRIRGPLEHHTAGKNMCWDSYEDLVARAACAFEDSGVNAVVLDIDSPGGEAAGSMQCHRMLRKLRQQSGKPLYAYANETACSAAYAIASACDEIWLPDTGVAGSIGVIATLFDRMKANDREGIIKELITSGEFKTDGHADRPITDGVRSRMQARVDRFADVFWDVVAAARKTSSRAVASLEAGVFVGQDAVRVGIADGVMARDAFIDLVSRAAADQLATLPDDQAAA